MNDIKKMFKSLIYEIRLLSIKNKKMKCKLEILKYQNKFMILFKDLCVKDREIYNYMSTDELWKEYLEFFDKEKYNIKSWIDEIESDIK